MKTKLSVVALGLTLGLGQLAAQNLYGDNADEGTPYIYVMNLSTMAVTQTITNTSGENGRGVVVVGNTMYYTSATTNNVFSYNLSNGTNNGSVFTVTVNGATALSTIAFDGTNLWIGDYSGKSPGVAYLYTTNGTLLNTITLSSCVVNCDGLEYFLQGGTTPRLISNRGDAVPPYDIYTTSGGAPVTSSFISPGVASTGIAYDGTNFEVSNIYGGTIQKYGGTSGTLISTQSITGYPGADPPLVEDLSANYAITIPTTPTGAPAPTTWLLMGCGVLFVAVTATLLRRKAVKA